MSRKFESADSLRRGQRRPNPVALRAAAQRAQARTSTTPSASAPQSPAPEPAQPMQEFALKMCTLDDVRDARHHILKFHSQQPVDPAHNFVPPIRMHRKDPRQLQVTSDQMDVDGQDGAGGGGGPEDGGSGAGGAGGAGPGAGGGETGEGGEPRRFRRRKTHQAYGGEKNEAARKLRYEEHYPWVMEDFDNNNTWVSSYEAAQSSSYAILTYDAASNGFKVVPIEKVYRMTPAARHTTLSLEDAEKKMESKTTLRDRWMMSHLQRGEPPAPEQNPSRLRTVVGSEERKHKYTLDEAMDFDDQELFDDDEGAPLLDGPEEDLKEAEDRIKQEQLKANELMDDGGDGDLDALFEDESREGKQGRKMRKALRALEKNQYYDTDDENNPYASSESENSGDELDMVKKEADDAQGDPAAAQAAAEAAASSMLVSQFRRKTVNRDLLPRGTVVLQLPPQTLARFPKGEWSPNARRSEEEDVESTDGTLTRNDVRQHIKSGETDLKQLLMALRPKLAENPGNRALLKTYIKEVARHRDGKLILRN